MPGKIFLPCLLEVCQTWGVPATAENCVCVQNFENFIYILYPNGANFHDAILGNVKSSNSYQVFF